MGKERSVTPKARVLIVSELSLFGEGVEGLLRQEPGLEIVGLETDPGPVSYTHLTLPTILLV